MPTAEFTPKPCSGAALHGGPPSSQNMRRGVQSLECPVLELGVSVASSPWPAVHSSPSSFSVQVKVPKEEVIWGPELFFLSLLPFCYAFVDTQGHALISFLCAFLHPLRILGQVCPDSASLLVQGSWTNGLLCFKQQ